MKSVSKSLTGTEPMIAKGSGSISYHFQHLLALLNVNYENFPLLLVTVKNGGITLVYHKLGFIMRT